MSTTERTHDATEAVDVHADADADAGNGASQTVKLDAAALRKLVVATVLTVDDSGPMLAAPAGPPERL
jgi:hypothetical protein